MLAAAQSPAQCCISSGPVLFAKIKTIFFLSLPRSYVTLASHQNLETSTCDPFKYRIGNPIVIRSIFEPRHVISNYVVCATSKATDQPAQTRSLI